MVQGRRQVAAVVKEKNRVKQFKAELATLNRAVSENLRLPSLSEKRLQGFAYHFFMLLPLLSSEGVPVFTGPVLQELFLVLDNRFGGCLLSSFSSAPPFWGLWHPPEQDKAEKDYLITVQVFANPIEPTNTFFTRLKQLLKTAGNIEQEEILISRTDCWLI